MGKPVQRKRDFLFLADGLTSSSPSWRTYAFFTRNLAPIAPALVELLKSHDQSVDPHLEKFAEAAAKAMSAAANGKGEEQGEHDKVK